jgi:hypothetical protein
VIFGDLEYLFSYCGEHTFNLMQGLVPPAALAYYIIKEVSCITQNCF